MGRVLLFGVLGLVVAGCAARSDPNVSLASNPAARSVVGLQHCRPVEAAETLLLSHGFHRESTFVRFETWSNRQGFRLVMGRLNGYLCVIGPEQGSVI